MASWWSKRPSRTIAYSSLLTTQTLKNSAADIKALRERTGIAYLGLQLPPALKEARARRNQLLRYELFANSGRFQSRTRDKAINALHRDTPRPFKWLVFSLEDEDDVQLVSPNGAAGPQAFADQLIRDPGVADAAQFILLPLHEEEALTLSKRYQDLIFIDDGQMFQTASPRSVLFGSDPAQLPRLVPEIENYSVKMHLSDATYSRMGGYDGSRELSKNDCVIAPVFTDLLRRLGEKNERFEVLGEDLTVCAQLDSKGGGPEIGVIFRTLPDVPAVPGFALFSPTKERLPNHMKASGELGIRTDDGKDHILAADAMEVLRAKNPTLSKEAAFVRLFAEPILDLVFEFYGQGVTLELHPQNFLLNFDKKTGDVAKIFVRDVHGTNYSSSWREKMGLPDLLNIDALQDRFPGISQDDLDGWFTRPHRITGKPELRSRYMAPNFFGRNFDVYLSIFFYQTLVALEEHGYLSRPEVDRIMVKIRDTVEAAAEKHGFDLALLDEGGNSDFSPDMKQAFSNGLRGKVLFRRPSDPDKRREYIAKYESQVVGL